METKAKKVLSALLTLVLFFCFALTITVHADDPPNAPTNLTAKAVPGGIELNWEDNSGDETHFHIYRKEGSSDWDYSSSKSAGANETTYLDDTAQVSVNYTYQIRACLFTPAHPPDPTFHNLSDFSNEASAIINRPAEPTNLKAEVGGGGITLTWTNNATDATSIEISKISSGGSWKTFATVSETATTFVDTDVEAGQTYRYVVRVYSSAVDLYSFWSDEAAATMPDAAIATKIDTQPSDIIITAGQSATFQIAASGTELKYQWQCVPNTGGSAPFADLTNVGIYSGVTTDTLTLSNVPASYDGYKYRCEVTGVLGKLTSNGVTLTVTAGGTTEIAVAVPVASPKGGTYSGEQTVVLTCATDGATIRYTTDGTNPTTLSPGYTAPFKISASATLKAVAIKSGLTDSAVMTENYIISTETATPPPADAAATPPEGSMGNFLQINTYKRGQFTDVDEDEWYGFNQTKAVAGAYEYGLMRGNSDTIFNPEGNVTIAEAITIAARVYSIYIADDESFVPSSLWYQVYVDYAIANGIVAANDFNSYTRAATRAEMAYIFTNSLPAAEFASQNTVKSLPDVNSGVAYRNEIIMLYSAGVLAGNDDMGTFSPSNNITRAEAAAIISRVILPDTRLSGKTFG